MICKYCGTEDIPDDETHTTKPHPMSDGTRLAAELTFEPEWDDEIWSSALKLKGFKTETGVQRVNLMLKKYGPARTA